VKFGAFGTSRKEQHQSDQGATLKDTVVAGANRSLAITLVIVRYNIT